MEVQCPNCATKLTVSSLAVSPAACSGCDKHVYFPQEGLFPPIVPLTFPSQTSAAVELVPFFHVFASELRLEVQEPSVTRPLHVMSEQQAVDSNTTVVRPNDVPAMFAESSDQPVSDLAAGGNGVHPPEATVDIERPPDDEAASGSLPDVAASLEPQPEELPATSEPATQTGLEQEGDVAVVTAGEDNLEILSLAGGSFAAALTPPPTTNKGQPEGSPSLQAMSTLGPAPWDTAGSVNGAPPPLARGNGGPPAIPKKSEMDSFAESLGLPMIPQGVRPEIAPPPAVVVSDTTSESDEEDGAALKKFRKKLFLYGGIAIVLCGGAGLVIASIASKDLQKPVELLPPPGLTGATAAASPTGAEAPTGGEATDKANGKDDNKAIDPKKRAAALEHYAKGNKLYLQRKYAASGSP